MRIRVTALLLSTAFVWTAAALARQTPDGDLLAIQFFEQQVAAHVERSSSTS